MRRLTRFQTRTAAALATAFISLKIAAVAAKSHRLPPPSAESIGSINSLFCAVHGRMPPIIYGRKLPFINGSDHLAENWVSDRCSPQRIKPYQAAVIE